MVKSSGSSNSKLRKIGFHLAIGGMFATILFIIIGFALFIPGYIIVAKQHKKPKEERDKALLITGYVLMGIGAVIGLGLGASVMLNMIGEDL